METSNDMVQTIITTINSILQNLFSSIDNNLYSILDTITFIDTSILNDSFISKLIGGSASEGLLLISNSLLLGFLLYFAIRLLLSHIIYSELEKPTHFIFKLVLCGLFMNFSFFILEFVVNIFDYLTESIFYIGKYFLSTEISFSNLILEINSNINVDNSTLNVFSLDGILKSTISVSLINLIFSNSVRYILIKVFILLSPFAFLSLTLTSSNWFFKSWAKNLFSLLFTQILFALILLIIFSITYDSTNLFSQIIYIGGIYSLIKINSVIRDFIGGLSTDISQSVNRFQNSKL